jgi:ATP-binding cassette subfamily B protein
MLAQAAGSVQHLKDLFDQVPEPPDSPAAISLPRLEREIVFDDVGFHYPDGSFELQGLRVRIAKNSYVAFVGGSGSGKSTVLSLLLRLYDPSRGAIHFDGCDVRCATRASLRDQIGMVFQDSFLFNASAFENIRMGRPGATMAEVEAAARAAEVHDFIASLPGGYFTVVGERGGKLSGGQRQRLAIARALVRDPSVLVLDEATSALDPVAEAALNATLLRLARSGRTVISVTHRLRGVVEADWIVVLGEGRVLEQGTHEDLLRLGGTYAGLWRQQTERGAYSFTYGEARGYEDTQ